MIDVTCELIKTKSETDEIGQEVKEIDVKQEVPIIRVLNISQKEFFEAKQHGIRLSLKLLISALNYDGQEELIYMGKRYVVIRINNFNIDEIELLCETKIGNNIND